MSEMWTVKQAAEHMGCHAATIRRMIQRGELPATKIGSTYRVRPGDLEPTTFTAAQKPSPETRQEREPAGRFARLARELSGIGARSGR